MTRTGNLQGFFLASLVILGLLSSEIYSKPVQVIDSEKAELEKDEAVLSLFNFKSRKKRSSLEDDNGIEIRRFGERTLLDKIHNLHEKESQNSYKNFEKTLKSMQRFKRSVPNVNSGTPKIPSPINPADSASIQGEHNIGSNIPLASDNGPPVNPDPGQGQMGESQGQMGGSDANSQGDTNKGIINPAESEVQNPDTQAQIGGGIINQVESQGHTNEGEVNPAGGQGQMSDPQGQIGGGVMNQDGSQGHTNEGEVNPVESQGQVVEDARQPVLNYPQDVAATQQVNIQPEEQIKVVTQRPVDVFSQRSTRKHKLKTTTKHRGETVPPNPIQSVTQKVPTDHVQVPDEKSDVDHVQPQNNEDQVHNNPVSEDENQSSVNPNPGDNPDVKVPVKVHTLPPNPVQVYTVPPDQSNGDKIQNGGHVTSQVLNSKTVQVSPNIPDADHVNKPSLAATGSVVKLKIDNLNSATKVEKTEEPCEGNNCIQVRIPSGRNKDALWALGSLTFLLLLLTGAVLYTGLWKKRHGRLKRWHKNDRRDSLSVAALLKRKPSRSSSNGYSDKSQNGAKKNLTHIAEEEDSDDDFL